MEIEPADTLQVQLAGLKESMTVSFHHHLRNGDLLDNIYNVL